MVVDRRGELRIEDRAVGDAFGDPRRRRPARRLLDAQRFALAGEGELAGERPLAVLIDDAAHGGRVDAAAHAVEHHLGHGGLSGLRLAARLEIDRLGEAAHLPHAVPRVDQCRVARPVGEIGFGGDERRRRRDRRSGGGERAVARARREGGEREGEGRRRRRPVAECGRRGDDRRLAPAPGLGLEARPQRDERVAFVGAVDGGRGGGDALLRITRLDLVRQRGQLLGGADDVARLDQLRVRSQVEIGAAKRERQAAVADVGICVGGERQQEPEGQPPRRETRNGPSDTRTTHTPQPVSPDPPSQRRAGRSWIRS